MKFSQIESLRKIRGTERKINIAKDLRGKKKRKINASEKDQSPHQKLLRLRPKH